MFAHTASRAAAHSRRCRESSFTHNRHHLPHAPSMLPLCAVLPINDRLPASLPHAMSQEAAAASRLRRQPPFEVISDTLCFDIDRRAQIC